MGRCVLEMAVRTDGVDVVCGLVPDHSQEAGRVVRISDRDIPYHDRLDEPVDVLIDVSLPQGTMKWLEVCERREIPLVAGVTGLDQAHQRRIREAAHQIPVVWAPNFSVGLAAILSVLGPLVRQLGEGFDVEIVEAHHREKVDSPSGTALSIVEAIRAARGGGEDGVVFGRRGKVGPRPAGEIAVHAVRMGDVVGQHEIYFSGAGETVTLKHEAHSREAFAAGALRAARWIVRRGAGFYGMADVLGMAGPEPGRKEPDPGF